jgi:hypothetical protein
MTVGGGRVMNEIKPIETTIARVSKPLDNFI